MGVVVIVVPQPPIQSVLGRLILAVLFGLGIIQKEHPVEDTLVSLIIGDGAADRIVEGIFQEFAVQPRAERAARPGELAFTGIDRQPVQAVVTEEQHPAVAHVQRTPVHRLTGIASEGEEAADQVPVRLVKPQKRRSALRLRLCFRQLPFGLGDRLLRPRRVDVPSGVDIAAKAV